ncbi:hypothetical protein N657DRAFT_693586 [Parathielavia appendiculata]|uniref:Uncharacterized protein n=1 Tax=Parathielavia appendiculata TaxID=2587402 RepID=A0AAN6YZQ1_9PEZI|nr:hypothetical protein N657DRAFT_693586 [Parathielavia appendiculata]
MDGKRFSGSWENEIVSANKTKAKKEQHDDRRPHWERDGVIFVRNGVKEDTFGPVNDNFDGADWINFRFGPNEILNTKTISTQLVRGIRESSSTPTEAKTPRGVARNTPIKQAKAAVDLLYSLVMEDQGYQVTAQRWDELLTFQVLSGEIVEIVMRTGPGSRGIYNSHRSQVIADPKLFNIKLDKIKCGIHRNNRNGQFVSGHVAGLRSPRPADSADDSLKEGLLLTEPVMDNQVVEDKTGRVQPQSPVLDLAQHMETALKEPLTRLINSVLLAAAETVERRFDMAVATDKQDLRTRVDMFEQRFAELAGLFLPGPAIIDDNSKAATRKRMVDEAPGRIASLGPKRAATEATRRQAGASSDSPKQR